MLIGVWAIYTMVSEEADIKNAIAEIQMLKDAAVQFRNNEGNSSYRNLMLDGFKSYLGTHGDKLTATPPHGLKMKNIYGGDIHLSSDDYYGSSGTGSNLELVSRGIPSLKICKRILRNFGETIENASSSYIPRGKAIGGYVAGPNYAECQTFTDGSILLSLTIN